MSDRKQPTSVLAAALAAGQLAVMGPLAVWVENRASFAGFSMPAALTLAAAFLALGTLFVLPALLAPRQARRISATLFTLTLLMWGQSFLSGRLLTGTHLAGSVSTPQVVAELLVWLVALVAAAVFAERTIAVLARLAVLAIVVQGLALGGASVSSEPGRLGLGSDPSEALIELAGLSASRNIIVLVLDGMHRDFATRILKENPELAGHFSGFRVFTDHLASFPTTRFSIPSMLSGQNYDNTVPAEGFILSTLTEGDTAPKRLLDAGWRVGLATTIRAALVAPADTRVAVDGYVRKQQTARALGLELLDLAAFRHAPARVGLWVYNGDRWRLRQLAGAARKNYHAVRSQDFMIDYVEAVNAATDEPIFRFIHIGGAHPPVVVNRECKFLGVQELSPASYQEQVECALNQAAQLLDRLRELELLDRTAFIIASDHGVDVTGETAADADIFTRVLDHAAATLMVKPFGAGGAPVFDRAPTSNQDLSTLVARLSDPATAEDYLPLTVTAGRSRSFNFHDWQNNDWRKSYLTALHRFRVGPGAASKSAWTYLGTTPSPELSAREQERLKADAATYYSRGSEPSSRD